MSAVRYGGPGEPRLGDLLWAKQMREARDLLRRWRELREAGRVCGHERCFEAPGVNGRWCLPHRLEEDRFRHSGQLRLVVPVKPASMWDTRSW